ncbi:hypothetical protein IDAT_10235 [Pseudidiomarina atlantica]|jgi:hypothetical protein|uniref:Uncharacterized protein n=1 Tax=Pseudidiomarina atlantica TaxID=1517416 RepID=A0A094J6I8_9GAMM|nr:hypothetical protein [Pseudidiomarina atlantica]KFZ28206.1 hypothetical protein IDAT_10235 [Pseudidiomarina atlantica]
MAITKKHLTQLLDSKNLEYTIDPKPNNRISLGLPTQYYKQHEGLKQNGFILRLDLEEPVVKLDEERIAKSRISAELNALNNDVVSLSDLREKLFQDVETRYQLLEFIAGPVNSYNAKTRNQKIELINQINSRIKFASFHLDRDEDIMFLYQYPVRNDSGSEDIQALSAETLMRLFGAISAAMDELYKEGSALITHAQSSENEESDNSSFSDEERSALTKTLLASITSQQREQLAKFLQGKSGFKAPEDTDDLEKMTHFVSIDVIRDGLSKPNYIATLKRIIKDSASTELSDKEDADE